MLRRYLAILIADTLLLAALSAQVVKEGRHSRYATVALVRWTILRTHRRKEWQPEGRR